MLLATSADRTASVWNVPSGTTWSTTPHVTLEEHEEPVYGGAFLGDESYVVTGSDDGSLLIWRTSDGVQTANYDCGGYVRHALTIYIAHHCAMQVSSFAYDAASGNIIVGLQNGHVEMWQTARYIARSSAPQVTLPAHVCVRERLAEAQALVKDIQASIGKADGELHHQMSREQELKRSIADLEAKCTHIF